MPSVPRIDLFQPHIYLPVYCYADAAAAPAAAAGAQYLEFTGDTVVSSEQDMFLRDISWIVKAGVGVVFQAPTITFARAEVLCCCCR